MFETFERLVRNRVVAVGRAQPAQPRFAALARLQGGIAIVVRLPIGLVLHDLVNRLLAPGTAEGQRNRPSPVVEHFSPRGDFRKVLIEGGDVPLRVSRDVVDRLAGQAQIGEIERRRDRHAGIVAEHIIDRLGRGIAAPEQVQRRASWIGRGAFRVERHAADDVAVAIADRVDGGEPPPATRTEPDAAMRP